MSVVEVAFASAVITGDFEGIQDQFRVGDVVASLSVSLMVAGFGLGPLFWSPVVSPAVSIFNCIPTHAPDTVERDSRPSTHLDYS